jgi:hypothetical protein
MTACQPRTIVSTRYERQTTPDAATLCRSARRAKRRVRQYRTMRYKLEDIITFLTVIEAGGPSAAAHRLGVAKSEASKRISDLEGELAATLLRRWTNLDTWLVT